MFCKIYVIFLLVFNILKNIKLLLSDVRTRRDLGYF